jgi:hypothetical protein
VRLLVVEVHHFVTELAFADVAAAVGLVQVDYVRSKLLATILTNSHLFFFHMTQ